MAIDTEKLASEGLFNRILNNKMVENDQTKFEAYMKEIFTPDSIPSQHELQKFNAIIVKEAEVLAQQKSNELMQILASTERTARGNAYQYEIPQQLKAKFVLSSNGSSVEHVRVDNKASRTLVPREYSFGAYYELDALSGGSVERFNEIVSKVADSIVVTKFELVTKLFQEAVATQKIPTANQLQGANLTLDQYVKFTNRFARLGGQAVMVADTALIDQIALQQTTNTVYQQLLTDDVKRELREAMSVTKIGRTTALNLVNPYIISTIGTANEQTQLPVNEGYVFSSGIGFKPIKLVEFGGVRQFSEFNKNLMRIEIDMKLDLALDFVLGETVGYVKDTALTI